MYIITYTYKLEQLKDYELQVEPPEEMRDFFRNSGVYPLSILSY
jgi:hypothetical protein